MRAARRALDLAAAHDLEPIAVREERLALVRDGDALAVVECEADGRLTSKQDFHREDLDAAFLELDERYLKIDGSRFGDLRPGLEILRALNDRNWDLVVGLTAKEFVYMDHQAVGVGRIEDGAQWVESMKPLIDLAPDTKVYLIKMEAVHQGMYLGEILATGTNDEGGVFEITTNVVTQYADGKLTRSEEFAYEALDKARARFEELKEDSRDD